MSAPTDRHMVFAVHDGYVKFESNFGHNLSGSEPLGWYAGDELIHEVSAQDMIDHLVSVFKPTTSEVIYADEEHHAEVDVPAWNPVTAMTAELEKGND